MRLARLLLLSALAAVAADAPLDVAASQSTVSFTLGDVLHTVHGTFALKRGSLRFDPATGKASGEIVVNAASGNSGSAARDRRMHSNILESEKYPDIVFRPDRVEGKVAPEGASEAVLHGVFTIHGGDHELEAPVHIEAADGRYTAVARFNVPYVKWGMKNPSTLILRVSDKVQIEARLVLRPSPGVSD